MILCRLGEKQRLIKGPMVHVIGKPSDMRSVSAVEGRNRRPIRLAGDPSRENQAAPSATDLSSER